MYVDGLADDEPGSAMSPISRRTTKHLRFGVTGAQGLHSAIWQLRVGNSAPDVYVTSYSGARDAIHVSLHASGQRHLRVRSPSHRDEFITALPVEQIAPGHSRLLDVLVLSGALRPPLRPVRPPIVWIPAGTPESKITFTIIREEAGVGANLSNWPGRRSMGTELVGRQQLVDGATIVVVAHTSTLTEAEVRQIETPWPAPTDTMTQAIFNSQPLGHRAVVYGESENFWVCDVPLEYHPPTGQPADEDQAEPLAEAQHP